MSETVFTYAAPALKFGTGASDELHHDLALLGARRVLLVTDPGVAATGHPDRVARSLRSHGVAVTQYAESRVEPTDASMLAAVEFARAEHASAPFEAILAVGGGSSIDTAKAVDLLLTNPGSLSDYLNPPIGRGLAPVNRLLPLVAVPTTTGTGAESTTVCVLDVLELAVKTGISHAWLRPTLAVVDPLLTTTQPAMVTASAGMDILCHALESYTARSYDSFERKAPEQRVPYCGANPISDLWSERSMSLLAGSFRAAVTAARSVARGGAGDDTARGEMALAATFAGLGFGNAGVHIPHANAYPVAGRVRGYVPEDYPGHPYTEGADPIVPHGMAVSLTAPASFRYTYDASPERHIAAARLLDPTVPVGASGPDVLPDVLVSLMRDIGIPNGLAAVGFTDADVPALVEGSLKQQRLLAIAPRTPSEEELAGIFRASMTLW